MQRSFVRSGLRGMKEGGNADRHILRQSAPSMTFVALMIAYASLPSLSPKFWAAVFVMMETSSSPPGNCRMTSELTAPCSTLLTLPFKTFLALNFTTLTSFNRQILERIRSEPRSTSACPRLMAHYVNPRVSRGLYRSCDDPVLLSII